MHQHSIFWGSFVFGTKAPTFMVWPWLASLLHLFRNGELCGCVLLIPQAEVEHMKGAFREEMIAYLVV